jgi:DNA (cytosine-5)-methyltransferase 1
MVGQNKIKMLDLFSGCGGLTDGFMQTGLFDEISGVEWKKDAVNTLRHRLANKWGKMDAYESLLHFDIQRENELFTGWENDSIYGSSKGMDYYVDKAGGIDIIIGGPPCQAYSVAGRVRDENGMKDDYRNFLFEHYLSVVDRYKPKLFIFENVPGLLSAHPTGVYVKDIITEEFANKGYTITNCLSKHAQFNAADFTVPQNRKRVLILGINNEYFKDFILQDILKDFYVNILPSYRGAKVYTVRDAIGDLPVCMPIANNYKARTSHSIPKSNISWQIPRYTSLRDEDTFKILAEDIESGRREYDSEKIADLYEKKIGSKSPIHRYHVLEPDIPSTTIIAHLYKDGNRFIHYDSKQMRSITPREAARIQSFDDDFEFYGAMGKVYEMIGNAVPPKLAKSLAYSVSDFINKYLS